MLLQTVQCCTEWSLRLKQNKTLTDHWLDGQENILFGSHIFTWGLFFFFFFGFAFGKTPINVTEWDDATVANKLHIVIHDKTITKQQREVTECIFLV